MFRVEVGTEEEVAWYQLANVLQVAAPFHAFYVASKCGLNGYFDTLRSELHLLGSRVTVGIQVGAYIQYEDRQRGA